MDPASGSPSQRIQYKPLDASRNEIRVLSFEPSLGAGDVTMQSTTGNSMYALQDVPGKGKGLVALEKIFKGTRILSEEPIITIPCNIPVSKRLRTSICQQVDALSERQRQAFLSMHNIHPFRNAAEQYLRIIQTNSLPTKTDGDKGAIFLEACRINHAYNNNAQKNWNKSIKRYTVYALRDINKGEEITITYIGALKNRKARRKAL
jgi:SET domain-containing protein